VRCAPHADHTVSAIAAIECVNTMAATNVPRVPLDFASLMEEDAGVHTLDATRGLEINSFARPTVVESVAKRMDAINPRWVVPACARLMEVVVDVR